MPPIDTDYQWVRIKAHRKHGKHRKLTSREIISVSSVISVWDKKGTQKARKTQKMLTSREIISVSSVSSVWDKKGHTDVTDRHRFMICIIHVDL